MTIENEVAYRRALRLSLELDEAHRQKPLMRQGRVITWLRDALEPLLERLSGAAIARFAYATSLGCLAMRQRS